MISTKENNLVMTQQKRSDEYIKRTTHLLHLAEEELISTDGHLISIKGLRKLRDKVDQLQLA